MTIPILKISVLRKPVIKGKMDARFPADVSVTSPIMLDRTGGNYLFGLSITDLRASLDVVYAPIGSGGLPGGASGQVQYNNGGVFGGLTATLNGVLVTNGAGSPSISTTLPNGIAMGTPASITLTNATGLPVSTGITGLGSGIATFLATPSSANLAAAVTDETGSGSLVLSNAPTLTNPVVGTQSARDNSTKAASTAYVDGATREKLSAARTYYVRSDGSDSNTGLTDSAGGAYATFAKAWTTITGTLDLGGQTVTIKIGGTTQTITNGLSIDKPWVGGGSIVLDGGGGTISTTSNNCLAVTVVLPGLVTYQNVKFQTTTSGSAVFHNGVGTLAGGASVNFGSVPNGGYHMIALSPGAFIQHNVAYTISGGASAHILASGGGAQVQTAGITVTVAANVTFGTSFVYGTRGGFVNANANTYSLGAFTVTGTRFIADEGGIVFTNGGGANYFPGSAAGSGTNFGASPYGRYI